MPEETIQLTVTVEVDKAKYERFRKIFDEQTWKDFVDYCVNGGHLDEILGDNPELMAEFLKAQTERQEREVKQTCAKPEILFTLTGDKARRLAEVRDSLGITIHEGEKGEVERVEFYLSR